MFARVRWQVCNSAMNRVFLILLLVSVLGSRGKSVLDTSHAKNQTAATLTNNIEPQFNASNGELLVNESSTISSNVSQEQDKDPIEWSETIMYNRFQNPSESKHSEDNSEEESSSEEKSFSSSSTEEEEEPEGPPDHAIPHSEHEEPRDVPTKPKYTAPGEWARPPKDKEVRLEFVPTKMYAQVRRTHTLRKLPREKAIENAESEEERKNAARLRAVVRNTKVNTVYSEEGYEDSAYDHGGHVRDADFHEGYARKLHDHLDLKRMAGDDDRDDQEEENGTKNEKYRRIEPEEFEEFDEDNGDAYETGAASKISDNDLVNPKLIAEKGMEKLQDDLEREAEEMEKGIEISKLAKVQTATDREILTESRKRDNYDGKMDRRRKTKQRKSSSLGNIENATAISMDENVISIDRAMETTTVKENLENLSEGSSGLYKYEVDDTQDRTTVSYGQLFWDYFKMRQDPLTATEFPLTLESTTLNQPLVQSYSVHEETTTSFPTIDPEISRPQEATSDSMDSEYSKDSGQNSELLPLDSTGLDEIWRSINSNKQLKTEVSPFSETYSNQGVPLLNLQNNNEAFVDQNFGTSLLGPTLNSANGRKLRYKITVRQKPKEPEKSSNAKIQSSNREPSTSSVISRPNKLIEAASRKPLLLNENYMKVLMHVKNEKNSKNSQRHHPNSLHRYNLQHPSNLQRNNHFSSGSNKNDLEDLTRMRPPLPQKAPDYYYNNFVGLKRPEIDQIAHSNRVSFPVSPSYRRAYTNPRTYQIYLDLPQTWQLPINRQRNAKQSFDLARSAPNDLTRQKEPNDYVNGGGNRWKQARNVSRSFGQATNRDGVRGIRAKSRERRSVGADDGDESGVANGSVVKNGTSNRGETEWAAKNLPSAGRNCRQKVTRLLQVGLDLDKSRAKQFRQKKSRYRGNDDVGEGSRAVERESIAASGNEGRNGDIKSDLRAFRYDDGMKQEGIGVLNLTGNESDADENDFKVRNESKRRAKLLDETSAVFGREKRELSVMNLVKKKENSNINEHENLLNETSQITEQKNGNLIDIIAENNTSKAMNEKGNATDTVKKKGEIYSIVKDELKERKLDEKFELGEKEDVEEKDSEDSEVKNELKIREKLFDKTEKKEEGYIINRTRKKKDIRREDSEMNEELKKRAELLDEAPKIAEDVINKEINARFNKDEQTNKEKSKEGKEDDNEEQVEVEIPEFDYVEELTEEDQTKDIVTTEATIDREKYPFYNNEKMPTPSALKYAIDPKTLPAKTYGAMEFYNSRDAYKQCDEIEPNLKVLPEKDEPVADRGPETNVPRLKGLGDKLDCYKAKYFDENPFDNPLFLEKQVDDPVAPAEIDSKQFASRITMMFPKEDDDYVIQKSSRRPESYRQPRKQAFTPVVLQKGRRIRYKAYPRAPQQMRIRKRPQSYRVQNSRIKYVKNPRRPLKIEKRPVASASEITSIKLPDITPYQSQVYEDVMGTIKNLANSYQVYEITTTPSSEGITTIDVTVNDVKTNSSTNSTSSKKKEKSNASKDIVDRPNNVKVGINIKGSVSNNKYQDRYRMYKRPRVSQNGRPRVQQMQKPVVGIRTVKRRRKIRIYKRDLSDGLNDDGKLPVASIELDSQSDIIEKKDEIGSKLSNSNEENYQPTKKKTVNVEYSTIEGGKNFPVQGNLMNSADVAKIIDARKRSKVPKSVTIDNSNGDKDQKEKPRKVVYTIKDRIRYSRPKGDVRKFGKFSNKTEVEEDKRRKEPRYNYIKRKSSSNPVLITAERSSSPSLTNRINWTESATTTEKVIELDSEDVGKENREIEYKIGETEEKCLNASENFNDTKQDLIGRSNDVIVNKTETGYAVHENVNEGEATTTQKPQLSTSSAFFDLKTFLDDDPPKYAELSNEDFEKSFLLNGNDTSGNSNVTLSSTNSNESLEEKESKIGKGNDEDTSKTFRQSYFSDEDSSERTTQTKEKENARSSKESSEESSVASKESESDERRPFFSYSSRPSSPAENYEDEKYSELGPRVNKPAFYHPPFFNYKTSRESSEELQESDKVKEEHVFPWYRDKEDERKRRRGRYRGRTNGRYEYPWERRERLEREERRRKKDKRKGLAMSFDDDEDEAEEASAAKYRRNIYPRGRHRFWSRLDSDTLEDSTSDNVESSSEYRPITRYSSRYNSRNVKLPVDEKSRSVKAIGRSIKKTLKDSSEGKEVLKGKETSSEMKEPAASSKSKDVSKETNVSNREKSADNSPMSVSPRNRNSSDLTKNTLENFESRITVVEGPRGIANSTKQGKTGKKKRRPLKNDVSTKSVTVANRTRQRQKSSSTTPAAVQPTFSTATTTSAPRFVRRRNQKAKDSRRKNYISNVVLNNSGNRTNSTSETETLGQSSKGRKGGRTNVIADEKPTKIHRDQELSLNSSMKQENLAVNNERENGPKNETVEERFIDDDVRQSKETDEVKRTFLPVGSDERFDFKDDRIETLSDFDKTDDDYEIASVSKTDGDFAPQNRALQLREQSSREIISSVSWISENYDF